MDQCTAAGIILYQPNIDRLKKNIESVYKQVKYVYCYNNGVNNIEDILSITHQYSNVILIGDGNNDGIARAINKIVKTALDNNVKWLLTLDQDSVCPPAMVDNFLKYSDGENIGALCPVVVDKRRPAVEMPKGEVCEVEFCITSGCFMKLDVFTKLGGMDEYLFIGLVDNEYSYRMVSNGFRIVRVNAVILDHELGALTPSRFSSAYLKLGELFHCDKFKALSYKRNISPFRLYHSTKNCIYLSRKYPTSGVAEFSKKFAIKNGLINILRSHFNIDVIRAFFRGLKELFR